MPVLKSLSFTALPKSNNDPVQQRRIKFINKLGEQKLLLKDPNHVRAVQRWTKVNGERQATTKQQAVWPRWKSDPSGQVITSIKFGAKPIEFEKGKAGIAVPSKDKLPTVIDTLIAAVRAGELDELFSQAAKTGTIGKARKAARAGRCMNSSPGLACQTVGVRGTHMMAPGVSHVASRPNS